MYALLSSSTTFAEYLQRKGLSEEYHYPISTFACLDENGWSEMGEMGWFGVFGKMKM